MPQHIKKYKNVPQLDLSKSNGIYFRDTTGQVWENVSVLLQYIIVFVCIPPLSPLSLISLFSAPSSVSVINYTGPSNKYLYEKKKFLLANSWFKKSNIFFLSRFIRTRQCECCVDVMFSQSLWTRFCPSQSFFSNISGQFHKECLV